MSRRLRAWLVLAFLAALAGCGSPRPSTVSPELPSAAPSTAALPSSRPTPEPAPPSPSEPATPPSVPAASPSPAIASASPTPASASPTPSLAELTGIHQAIDFDNLTRASVVTDPEHSLFGRFSFAIRGVGVFWASGASIVTHPDSTIDVSYVGVGSFDGGAKVDLYLGMHDASESKTSTTLDLAIRLGPEDSTGSGTLVADGKTYPLSRPEHDPPAPTEAIDRALEYLRVGDWFRLRGAFILDIQGDVSLAEFEDGMEQGMREIGSIVAIRRVGPVTLHTGAWTTAEVALEVDVEKGGTTTTRSSRMWLLFEGREWRISTIDPPGS